MQQLFNHSAAMPPPPHLRLCSSWQTHYFLYLDKKLVGNHNVAIPPPHDEESKPTLGLNPQPDCETVTLGSHLNQSATMAPQLPHTHVPLSNHNNSSYLNNLFKFLILQFQQGGPGAAEGNHMMKNQTQCQCWNCSHDMTLRQLS